MCSLCQLPPLEPTLCLALGSLDTHKLHSVAATHLKRFLWMATTHTDSFGDYSETVISRAARRVVNYDAVRFSIAFPCKHCAVCHLCLSPSAFKDIMCIDMCLWLLRQRHVGAGDLSSWFSTLRGASDESSAGVRWRLIATDFRGFKFPHKLEKNKSISGNKKSWFEYILTCRWNKLYSAYHFNITGCVHVTSQ